MFRYGQPRKPGLRWHCDKAERLFEVGPSGAYATREISMHQYTGDSLHDHGAAPHSPGSSRLTRRCSRELYLDFTCGLPVLRHSCGSDSG